MKRAHRTAHSRLSLALAALLALIFLTALMIRPGPTPPPQRLEAPR